MVRCLCVAVLFKNAADGWPCSHFRNPGCRRLAAGLGWWSFGGPLVEASASHDQSTTPHCSFWYDHDGSTSCKDVVSISSTPLAELIRWVS